MQIAIDASRATLRGRTGTENYALNIIRAMLALASPRDHRFTLYFRDAPEPVLFPPGALAPHRMCVLPRRRLWTHFAFASALFRDRPDVAFVPAHTLPFVFPGRAVVTVHDLGYRRFPAAHRTWERLYLELTTWYSARRATRVIAVSEATRADLARLNGIPVHKVDVIYPGVETLERASETEIGHVRRKYGLPERYFLFLGTLQPRKNIRRLCEAFAQFVRSTGESELALVLAGKPGWRLDVDRDVLPSLPAEVRSRVMTTGYVLDTEVAALYSGALALVFPSLYEGFGFPVLEAMRCDTPVLCSNTSSLPELAGDAAMMVDPLDVNAVAAGMARLASDSNLRMDLATRGRDQASKFSWKRAAEQTLDSLERAGTKQR